MIRGYKGWKVSRINGNLALVSPVQKQEWIPGENVSICERCKGVDESCTCGIYALKGPSPELIPYGPDIVGEILMWGNLIVGEHGYRTKRAQVSVLFIPTVNPSITEEELNELANKYGVQIAKAPTILYDGIARERKKRGIARGLVFPNIPQRRCSGGQAIGDWVREDW